MIKIKGLNGNLVFVFGKGSFEQYLSLLEGHFANNKQLFNGSKIIFKGTGLENLSHEQIAALQLLCLQNGMVLNNREISLDKGLSKDLIIHRNVRSGQKLRSEGSVIIWGHVHESAELVAARDIIVLGKLDGIVHAGCYGERDSIVFALNLNPGQIRIADKISRSPEDVIKSSYPEIAYLEEDSICIKEYKTNSKLR